MQANSMFIFDLDGTLDLTDRQLSVEIHRMAKMGVSFVTATGRTNSYVKETCKKYDIIPPRFIIADNGGTIYDNLNQEYVKRTTLQADTRTRILEEYIRLGGIKTDIRYTDGDYVYASETAEVRKYYEKEKSIQHKGADELVEAIFNSESDITKVTLAGNKKLMKDIIKFINENDIKCWTDIGTTAFPQKSRKNYRLDITDGQSSKGEAVEFLTQYTGIRDFTCIGNGPNDFSMFKYALDSGMPIIVVKNSEEGKITKESELIIEKVEEYARSIGREDKVTVAAFPINRYIRKMEESKTAKQRRKSFVEGLRANATSKVDGVPKGMQTRLRRKQYKDGRG